jgi:DNA repair protein RadC
MTQQLSFFQVHSPSLRVLRETPAARVLAGAGTSLLEEIAALIGDPDVALAILTGYPTVIELQRATPSDLEHIKGLGPARIAALKAALSLGRRMTLASSDERRQIRSPIDAAQLLLSEMGALEQEQFRVMLLDTRMRVINIPTLYMGNLNTIPIRAGEVFRDAIRHNASAIIVAHNHPSGDPSPSPEDVAVTRSIIAVGKMLDIDVLDHLVISAGKYVSMKERGVAFVRDETT